MPPEMNLPFGHTQVSVDEIAELIDRERAIQLLQEKEVESAEEKVNRFIEHVPLLLEWLENEGRIYPWRNTQDTWHVYISEILLQRTRADAVEPVYQEFFSKYPDPCSLDEATEDEIRSHVKPLGFVNHRTKTLTDVAQIFCNQHENQVPDSLEDMKAPWRVGDYVARAVQLFSRNKPVALVDANVSRVVGGILDYPAANQPHKDDDFYKLMAALTPSDPGIARAFYLSILDLGAHTVYETDNDLFSYL